MGGKGSGGHNLKTEEQKELEGYPGKRRPKTQEILKPAPLPEFKMPSCPKWLDAEAKKEWRRICRQQINLTPNDWATLAGYCSEYAKWRKAEEILIAGGYTQFARHGTAPRPEVKISHDALAQMRAFAIELGITPKSRIATPSPPKTKEPEDPMEKALGTKLYKLN